MNNAPLNNPNVDFIANVYSYNALSKVISAVVETNPYTVFEIT